MATGDADYAAAEAAFRRELVENWAAVKRLTGYATPAYIGMIERLGAVEAARRLLAGPGDVSGLLRLKQVGMLDLSLEATVRKPEYAVLFTEAEQDLADRRLRELSSF